MTLSPEELYDTADAFGVDLEQVVRDHAISHALASISHRAPDAFVFIGGTMLSRTWLPDVRLSEDIDLVARTALGPAARALADALETDLSKEFGAVEWDLHPTRARDAQPVVLTVAGQVRIQLQLMTKDGRGSWPSERMPILQRYSDAPPARLHVPTRAAAAAMKLSAWLDRRAPRDMYDLYAMALRGMLTRDVRAVYARYGQTTGQIPRRELHSPPGEAEWIAALGHQCRLGVTAAEATGTVTAALDAVGALTAA